MQSDEPTEHSRPLGNYAFATAGSSCVTAVCLVEVGNNASKLVERRDGMCEVRGRSGLNTVA